MAFLSSRILEEHIVGREELMNALFVCVHTHLKKKKKKKAKQTNKTTERVLVVLVLSEVGQRPVSDVS